MKTFVDYQRESEARFRKEEIEEKKRQREHEEKMRKAEQEHELKLLKMLIDNRGQEQNLSFSQMMENSQPVPNPQPAQPMTNTNNQHYTTYENHGLFNHGQIQDTHHYAQL